MKHGLLAGALKTLLLVGAVTTAWATPVEFAFELPDSEREAQAREVWADIVTPSGARREVPAFHRGDDSFAVRTTADETGTFRLERIRETIGAATQLLEPASVTPANRAIEIDAARLSALPFVRLDPRDPTRFVRGDDTAYVPIGSNLPWPTQEAVVPHYRERFVQFRASGLNWARIWTSHWGGLNLDWLRERDGPSPLPGAPLDARVAERWDRIVELAEENGVYLQIVLQHHGQFSTRVNPNWADHPWNAANPGGFLDKPSDFFTTERARELTKRKYRTIVARWGYSPAVLAWELFNEVHWVDAIRLEHNEAAVAQWHDEMAAWIRSVDAHRHLVTTSTDDVHSPVYATMDFLQPHLYARDMLAAARVMATPPGRLRPVFFGEIGDDHLPISAEQKRLNRGTMPPVWSGLMGDGTLPPQIWYGDRLIGGGQMQELTAVARFLRETGLCERGGLRPFSPAIESTARIPQRIRGVLNWRPRLPAIIRVSFDGRESEGLGNIASHLVSAKNRIESGFPDSIRFHVEYPRNVEACVRLGGAGAEGSEALVLLDDDVVARRAWPAGMDQAAREPGDLVVPIPAGAHVIDIRNDAGPDWFEFIHFDTGFDTPAIGAVGKRNDDFVALWLWHRENVHALEPAAGASGTITIPDVPAGTWTVTWWDSVEGRPQIPHTVEHHGGGLRLETPLVSRHAAVVLFR